MSENKKRSLLIFLFDDLWAKFAEGIWTAVDRNEGKIVDFIVGDNRIENAYLLMYRILTNNENKNFNIEYHDTLNTIDYLCTDGHNAYEKVANHPLFKHNIKHHIISKSEIQSPSYASLLAITNLLLDTV